jgi:hypothetical protein
MISLSLIVSSLLILVTGRALVDGVRFAPIRRNVRAPSFLPYLLLLPSELLCSVLARPSSQSGPLASSLVVSCLPPLSNHSTPVTPMKELQRVCFLSFFSRYETCMRKSKETYQGGEHKGYIVMLHK